MIATISMDESFINESLSTCRFATRVSLIENTETVNIVVDPNEVAARLIQENRFLRDQLSTLQRSDCSQPELTDDENRDLEERIRKYLHGPSSCILHMSGSQMVRSSALSS